MYDYLVIDKSSKLFQLDLNSFFPLYHCDMHNIRLKGCSFKCFAKYIFKKYWVISVS